MWSFVKEKKEEGKIKHIGFSFHSTPEELEKILKEHPEMEFVQLQINYADWENPAIQSKACYEVARKYNKPVIIMEPVKGGMLANPPEAVAKVLKEANPSMSMASWAVKFAANLDGVITVLSGMSSREQMDDNISYMKDFTKLSEEDKKTIDKAQEEWLVSGHGKAKASECIKCGACEGVCPQHIKIREELEKALTLCQK